MILYTNCNKKENKRGQQGTLRGRGWKAERHNFEEIMRIRYGRLQEFNCLKDRGADCEESGPN